MATLSALYCVRNEESLVKKSIELVLPYVDEIIFVDNGSTDNTKFVIPNDPKIKVFDYPKTDNMGEVRTFALRQATCDWFIQIDADEMYPAESMEKIRAAIESPGDAISIRIKYYNLAWRSGFYQSDLNHFPDRLYKREVVDKYGGLLPNDMTMVKSGFYDFRPYLEYDNASDRSFGSASYPQQSPKQPIREDIYFFHLARTRGYNFEYKKWTNYNKIHHKGDVEHMTRVNQWVSGRYAMKNDIQIPSYIPKTNIIEPKVSIIITNFNYSRYVGDAIKSALGQTYKPHEVIVVDDFSTDNSLEVIRSFPVTVIARDHNGGPGASRNSGIAASTGDYFILLDADDKLRPNAVEVMLRYMTGDVQVVYPDMQWFGSRSEVWHMPEPTRDNILQRHIVPSVCALIDRHCFDLSGGFRIDAIYEDWEFFLNLMLKCGFNFKHVGAVLLDYRGHGKSRSSFSDSRQVFAYEQLKRDYPITADGKDVPINEPIEAEKPRVAFVMDKIVTCGGIMVPFEYVSRLKKRGYDADIYANNRNYDLEELYGITPKPLSELATLTDNDVIIAVWWQQVPYLEQFKGRKIQFVQGNDLDAYSKDPGLLRLMSDCINTRLNDKWEILGVSDFAVQWTNRKGTIIENGVNERFFCDEDTTKDIDILIEGNPEPHKNIGRAISLAKKSSAKSIAWLGRETYFVDGVKNYTNPPQPDIPEIYKKSKILIKLSTFEGFSLPVLEAMAARCAVVTRDMGGNLFCKNNINCVLSDNDDELLYGINRLLSDDGFRHEISSVGYDTAKDFSWEKSVDKMEKLLKNETENNQNNIRSAKDFVISLLQKKQ